jgi:two-component system chemotaxis response regulator CheY
MASILIADDASFMRSSLKFIVESAGHEVVGLAKNGEEAAELFEKHRPDIVTLDILMDGGDGLSALKKIMESDLGARVIMISAMGHKERQEEAKTLGAAGFIRKPFKAEDILAEIERIGSHNI